VGIEFAALASQLEGLADKYAPMTENISLSYRYALSCEQYFFSAAYSRGKS
jgi:thiaminase/transcriptional activator TenA